MNPIILDFPINGAIWVQGEGIWLRDTDALVPVMDQMSTDGYLVQYAPGLLYEVSTGYIGYLQAIASKPDEPGGLPQRVHIMSLVTN